jgi:hypothetical protein
MLAENTADGQYKPAFSSADLSEACQAIVNKNLITLEPFLPLLLSIRGKPYTLDNFYPFSPLFGTMVPERSVFMTGRQIAKSMSTAAQGIVTSAATAHFNTLYIAPLFEMIRRFSKNYVGYLIQNSPVKELFKDVSLSNSILQRSFKNSSTMHFSFAGLDAERTRGYSVDRLVTDETQDIDMNLFPIIVEVLAASSYGIIQHMGTAKTPNNTLTKLYEQSSMAEWVVKCHRCNFENIPAVEYHLIDMIGPWHPDISRENPGTICAKCRRSIFPRPTYQGGNGRYYHRYPEKKEYFAGYHVPQIVLPMHFESPRKWKTLLRKLEGVNTPYYRFLNEVCGVPADSGSRFLTEGDLRKAAVLPWGNKLDEALPHLPEYSFLVCAVDWGGGGVMRGKSLYELQSYTTVAVCGLHPDGHLDVIFGYRSSHPHDHVFEAKVISGIMSQFNCNYLAHDYTGAGTVRETLIIQSGVHPSRVLPMVMVGNSRQGIVVAKPASSEHPRFRYSIDRNRALNYVMQFIKSGAIRFFKYDYTSPEDPGLLQDFLFLIEDKKNSGVGGDYYKILRDPSGPDDFAQAVMMGAMAVYELNNCWPDLSKYEQVQASFELTLPEIPPQELDSLLYKGY